MKVNGARTTLQAWRPHRAAGAPSTAGEFFTPCRPAPCRAREAKSSGGHLTPLGAQSVTLPAYAVSHSIHPVVLPTAQLIEDVPYAPTAVKGLERQLSKSANSDTSPRHGTGG
jgi:hypothetical protein